LTLQFITPEIGKAGEISIVVQSGLRAQALRYVQILLENTGQIAINVSISVVNDSSIIRVPSPAAFIFQKALTLPPRRLKAAKDLYYDNEPVCKFISFLLAFWVLTVFCMAVLASF
jgi:hypothetical protein